MKQPRILMQGNLVLAVDMSPCRGNPEPSPRGEIKGFSAASRKRMIQQCARMGNAVPVFVTLTYGAEWPACPSVWKSHLDTWWKRVIRKHPDCAAIWRLEPQERGAPHYHLLIYRKTGKRPFLPFEWVAKSWAKVTDGDASACSRVEALKSHRGGMFYAAKYCAKLGDGSLPDGWEKVGKHWGILSKANLPYPPQHEMVIHSKLEQSACLYAMADAFKASFLASATAQYEADRATAGIGHKLALMDWDAIRSDNEYFGNTATFYGTGEDFLAALSSKLASIEIHLAARTGRPVRLVRKDIDTRLASV